MIARQIRPEEIKRTEELFSISFDSAYENEHSPMELYQKYKDQPRCREQEHSLERFAAFEDDGKTMMSSFIMQPFDIRFDGHDEPMFSIGGVATLPQYRKRGGIRACFTEALPYLYEKNVVFSYLYPFSTAYYRKFGYEMCSKRMYYSVALSFIPSFSVSGSCYLLDSSTASMAARDIPHIYSVWQKKYNTMVLGVPYDFHFIQNANPYKDQVFTYVYRSAAGEPLAYMTFRNQTDPAVRQIECSRFFYLNEEGFEGLLTLARSFATDYRRINFSLPTDSLLERLIPEWSQGAVDCHLYPNGMIRVINVQKALQDAAYLGDGSCTIQVEDPFIAQNNHIFRLVFENGLCKSADPIKTGVSEGRNFSVTPCKKSCMPDITLSIAAFSALITGGYESSALEQFPGVSVHGNAETLKRVFYKKPVFITTNF